MVVRPVRRKSGESGQAVVLVALAIGVFLLAAVGWAIDGSQLYAQRQMAQTAADAAAQAGIMSIRNGSSAIGTSSYYCTSGNSTSPCAYASNNGFTSTYGSGSCTPSIGSDCIKVDPNPGVVIPPIVSQLQVTVTRAVNMTLTKMLPGVSSFNVTASSRAAVVAYCVTALTGLNTSNANINLQNCGTARTAPDPLASVAEPSYSSTCDYTGGNYSGNLSPGTYCGGITLTGDSTFNSGTYILLGGGLNATGNITLTGTGVTFYNTYSSTYQYVPISIAGTVIANLSATANGPLQGILFFQDRTAPSGNTESFVVNAGSTLTGALYFPESAVSYTGSSSTSYEDIAIIGYSVLLAGNTSLEYDPTQAGAPLAQVALVQ